MHLTVHLVREVNICGLICLRWMYLFERDMKVLKGYVTNCNRLEGCNVQNCVTEEVIEFCPYFLSDVDKIGISFNKNMFSIDEINVRKLLSEKWVENIDREMWKQANRCALHNIDEVHPCVE